MKIFFVILGVLLLLGVGIYLLWRLVCVCICGLAIICSGAIGAQKEYYKSGWDYWEKNKGRKWDELSKEEQDRLVMSQQIIAADVGIVVTEEEIREALKEQLPITTPHEGLSFKCKPDA